MLKKDKLAFLGFIADDSETMRAAVDHFESCEPGHFEEHPISRSLILQHIDRLIHLWHTQTDPTIRNWIIQFVAESSIVTAQTKPIIDAALLYEGGSTLRLALYAAANNARLFEDIGDRLLSLASHPDYEVRWRVGYVLCYMKNRCDAMRKAIEILKNEPDDLIQTYVGEL